MVSYFLNGHLQGGGFEVLRGGVEGGGEMRLTPWCSVPCLFFGTFDELGNRAESVFIGHWGWLGRVCWGLSLWSENRSCARG